MQQGVLCTSLRVKWERNRTQKLQEMINIHLTTPEVCNLTCCQCYFFSPNTLRIGCHDNRVFFSLAFSLFFSLHPSASLGPVLFNRVLKFHYNSCLLIPSSLLLNQRDKARFLQNWLCFFIIGYVVGCSSGISHPDYGTGDLLFISLLSYKADDCLRRALLLQRLL